SKRGTGVEEQPRLGSDPIPTAEQPGNVLSLIIHPGSSPAYSYLLHQSRRAYGKPRGQATRHSGRSVKSHVGITAQRQSIRDHHAHAVASVVPIKRELVTWEVQDAVESTSSIAPKRWTTWSRTHIGIEWVLIHQNSLVRSRRWRRQIDAGRASHIQGSAVREIESHAITSDRGIPRDVEASRRTTTAAIEDVRSRTENHVAAIDTELAVSSWANGVHTVAIGHARTGEVSIPLDRN